MFRRTLPPKLFKLVGLISMLATAGKVTIYAVMGRVVQRINSGY